MPKLAIYVPKEEMKKIDRWRKKINFSRVFMQALAREIANQTRVVEAPDGKLAAAAAYYQNKLAENSGPLVDFGFEIGASQVVNCRLQPHVIRQIVELVEFNSSDRRHAKIIETALQDAAAEIEDYAAKNGLNDDTNPTWRSSVLSGYVEGVKSGWKQVCQAMNGPPKTNKRQKKTRDKPIQQ